LSLLAEVFPNLQIGYLGHHDCHPDGILVVERQKSDSPVRLPLGDTNRFVSVYQAILLLKATLAVVSMNSHKEGTLVE
jgi:hypothetical protein